VSVSFAPSRTRTSGPERLKGGEAGVRVEATRNVSFRSTWYDNRVEEPGCQRHDRHQPAAAAEPGTHAHPRLAERRRGAAITSHVRVAAGYLLNDAKVTEYNPAPLPGVTPVNLVGLYLPQVPKHRGVVLGRVPESALRQRLA
jgi:hypothetical protein